MKKSKKNMHRAYIIAAIREKGSTLAQLSIDAGLHPRTLGNALERKYPKGEKIIADFIGIPPQEIWPERY
ncbi:transcriptional regulator [Haemophilus parainfluenzae]|jgi:ner|uniref:helix-turn-helix domain-containing protein n=1 Tax=Pasteurellaceae TaxID=712 RepID=UPI000C9AFBCB|nr:MULTISPECIES: helix-turn-helix domain-containing protein [Pasteurellaceae]PMC56813.1 transcriptional regulator [Haemophilus parainfluenzae]DAN84664.1 MAG TPA: putative transcriptional regulator [Caudoviricetes sp.]DAT56545.1 MAG TPA: putative transcriptional regulator [Caudoviricetes sp.]